MRPGNWGSTAGDLKLRFLLPHGSRFGADSGSILKADRHYNGVRPHSALGYRPPAPETIAFPAFGFASSGSSLGNQGVVLH